MPEGEMPIRFVDQAVLVRAHEEGRAPTRRYRTGVVEGTATERRVVQQRAMS